MIAKKKNQQCVIVMIREKTSKSFYLLFYAFVVKYAYEMKTTYFKSQMRVILCI